jgi:repressor LexA
MDAIVDDARAALIRLSAARGESLAELSRMLRRNAAYLQQFVQRGTPRRLAEDDRRLLARHFGVDELELGGPPAKPALVAVPYLAVRAAAGQGLAADESLIRTEPFAPSLLRELGVAPDDASLVSASGDSMAPTLLDGDRLLVDRGDARVGGEGIFVFRRDDLLSVKRVARVADGLRLVSDNAAYPTITVPRAEVTLIGRVKLLLRRPA